MLNNNMERILKAQGQLSAKIVSGNWIATKPFSPHDPCLNKDITLGISTENIPGSHKLVRRNLCEACEL